MEHKLVSVIITTYGGGSTLKRALSSVLCQEYEDYEIIVVDDNDPNTNERVMTESIMAEFSKQDKVLYLKHPQNLNGAVARNTALKVAKGEYVAFLDDDDIMLQGRLRQSVDFLEKHTTVSGVCFGVVSFCDKCFTGLMQCRNSDYLTIEKLLIDQNAIGSGSNIFLRHNVVNLVEGFDGRFLRFQDVEFMIRVLEKGIIQYQEDILIAKETVSFRIPNYRKVSSSFQLFSDKFFDIIQLLNQDTKFKYLNDRYTYLFSLAKAGGKTSDILEAGQRLSTLRTLTKRESLEIKYVQITAFVWKIKAILRSGSFRRFYSRMRLERNKVIDRNIRQQLPEGYATKIFNQILNYKS